MVTSSLHFSHKSQPQMHSQAMGTSNILCPLSASLPLGEGGRDTAERRRGVDCVPCPWRHTKQTRICVKAWDSIALMTAIGSAGHLFGRNCPLLRSTTFAQHLTLSLCNLTLHMFSHRCTQCYRHRSSSPKQEDLFISLRHIVISADSCCLFLV